MQQLNLITGQTKEQEAIGFIQEHEPPEGYFLGFSGGKDSGVLYDLTVKAGVKFEAYYSLMPDPPELIQFVKRFPVKIIRPEKSFWTLVETKFPPNRNARWCCDYIKEKPSTKIPLTYRLLGIRAEEGPSRAKRGRINQITRKRINIHPLFTWLEWEVWDYIESNGLPHCSLYDEGFNRLGCVVCPERTNTKAQELFKQRWPQYFRLFEKQVRKWWKAKGQYRENEKAKSADEFLNNWYRGK